MTNSAAKAAGNPTPLPLTGCNGPPRIVALGAGDGVVVPTRKDPLDDEATTDGDRAGVGVLVATTGPVDWLGAGVADDDGLGRGVVV